MKVFRVNIDGYNPESGQVETIHLTTSAGGRTSLLDTPPNTHYVGRIIQPGSFTREIFSDGNFFGQSKYAYGEITATNPDGGLDHLMNWGFDGRVLSILYGEEDASYPNGFDIVLVGTVESASFGTGKISFKLRDDQAGFNQPFNTTFFLGNNAAPLGLEGTPDMRDKRRQSVIGFCKNFEARMVNSSKLIYHVSAGKISDGPGGFNVADKGVILPWDTWGVDIYTDVIAAGKWRYYNINGQGYIRLGSPASGQITIFCNGGDSLGTNDAIAFLLSTLNRVRPSCFLDYAGMATMMNGEEWQGAFFFADAEYMYTLLDPFLNPYRIITSEIIDLWMKYQYSVIGHLVRDDEPISSVMDVMATSLSSWWGFDRFNRFRIGWIQDPEDMTPVAEWDLDTFYVTDIGPGNPTQNGLPSWQLEYKYERNYTVQSASDLAASAIGQTWSQLEYWSYIISDPNIKAKYLTSQPYSIKTSTNHMSFSAAEAARLFNLFATPRINLAGWASLDRCLAVGIDLGVCVRVKGSRYGLGSGKNFIVKRIEPNLLKQRYDLVLWG